MKYKSYLIKVNEKEISCLRRILNIVHFVARRDKVNIYKHLPLMKSIEKKIKKIEEEINPLNEEDDFL